jgi:hypothetical protein
VLSCAAHDDLVLSHDKARIWLIQTTGPCKRLF